MAIERQKKKKREIFDTNRDEMWIHGALDLYEYFGHFVAVVVGENGTNLAAGLEMNLLCGSMVCLGMRYEG